MLPDEQETGHKKPQQNEKKIIKEDRDHKDRGRPTHDHDIRNDSDKPAKKNKD
jgi:hypothetical protein